MTDPGSPDTADYWPEWPHTPTGAELEDVFDGVEPVVAIAESAQYAQTVTSSRGITYRLDPLGSRTKQYEQVGNAVPPMLAAHVIGALTDSPYTERIPA